jgi:hypothetical protein
MLRARRGGALGVGPVATRRSYAKAATRTWRLNYSLGVIDNGFTARPARDQVVGGLSSWIPVGAAPTFAPIDARDADLSHEPLDKFSRAPGVLAEAQLGVDPRRSIGAAHAMDVDDGVGQHGIAEVAVTHGVGPPGIEARGGHLHHPTAGRHGKI